MRTNGSGSKQIVVWVPEEVAEAVKAAAEAEDRTITAWVRRLLCDSLDVKAQAPS